MFQRYFMLPMRFLEVTSMVDMKMSTAMNLLWATPREFTMFTFRIFFFLASPHLFDDLLSLR
jgi:hypothetical protein